jgi:hypothetical protein
MYVTFINRLHIIGLSRKMSSRQHQFALFTLIVEIENPLLERIKDRDLKLTWTSKTQILNYISHLIHMRMAKRFNVCDYDAMKLKMLKMKRASVYQT